MRSIFHLVSIVAAIVVLGWSQAQAAVITHVNDTFESPTASEGADADDAFDIPYFDRNNRTTFSIVGDTILGGAGNMALFVNASSSFNPNVGTLYNSGGSVPASVSLGANTGDMLTFSFDFRIQNISGSNGGGFRFGLYSSDSQTTSDNDSSSDDSQGYLTRLGTGGSTGIFLRRELGTLNQVTNGAGGDFFNIINGTPAGVGINDTNAHSIEMKLTRRADSGIDISLMLDAVEIATGTDTSAGLVDTFDEVAFGNGSATNDYFFDNILITTEAFIPEPASFALIGLGSLALLRRRYR